MTCDEVINQILDEEAVAADELELHLSTCQRCRSLQEILSPLKNYSPTDSGEESFKLLPTEAASTKATAIALDAAQRLQMPPRPAQRKTRSSLTFLKYAAAFLAGMGASLGGIAALRSEPIQPVDSVSTACLWESEFSPQQKQAEFVRSCVACHLISN